MAVYFDTDRSRPGPEWAFYGALFANSDYLLAQVKNWKPASVVSSCDMHLALNFRTDVSALQVSNQCLGSPSDIRVGIEVMGTRSDGSQAIEWVGGTRHFTPWLAAD